MNIQKQPTLTGGDKVTVTVIVIYYVWHMLVYVMRLIDIVLHCNNCTDIVLHDICLVLHCTANKYQNQNIKWCHVINKITSDHSTTLHHTPPHTISNPLLNPLNATSSSLDARNRPLSVSMSMMTRRSISNRKSISTLHGLPHTPGKDWYMFFCDN